MTANSQPTRKDHSAYYKSYATAHIGWSDY